MGMILVTPMNAAKMKLAMMAANLQMPFRMPKAVPLEIQGEIQHVLLHDQLNQYTFKKQNKTKTTLCTG